MDIKELCKFLVKAKNNTYASGREGTTLKNGSKELVFSEGKCLWGMNYYGYTIPSEGVSSKEIYTFLRDALKGIDEEKPFRGPEKYEKNSFKYLNNVKGDVDGFNGIEKILYKGKEVYRLLYHGGFTRGET